MHITDLLHQTTNGDSATADDSIPNVSICIRHHYTRHQQRYDRLKWHHIKPITGPQPIRDFNMATSEPVDFVQRARAGVRELMPYQPGKPPEELSREMGIDDAIKLASNENPLGPGALAKRALVEGLGDMGRYPDGSGFALKTGLSRHLGVSVDGITLGNGSNEVLEFIVRVFAGPGDEVVFSEHCFTVYPAVTLAAGATPIMVPASQYGHDLGAMVARVTPSTRVMFIANPNNPTGTWNARDELVACLDAVPSDLVVVLDEAYFEYVTEPDYPDGLRLLERYPNLVVVRTFSKIHGLAALRIGYAISNPVIADLMNRVRQPFNANVPAMAAALAALDDNEHVSRSRDVNCAGLMRLGDSLRQLGLAFIPSVANFITFHTAGDAMPIYQGLLREGVIVRPIGGYGLPEHLRVSIGTDEENSRFLAALQRVMSAEGRL